MSKINSFVYQGSNRTLLELKFVFVNGSIIAGVFQSYLTGIEINYLLLESGSTCCVPIVPYWN